MFGLENRGEKSFFMSRHFDQAMIILILRFCFVSFVLFVCLFLFLFFSVLVHEKELPVIVLW